MEAVRRLVESGHDIDEADAVGMSVMHFAVRQGNVTVVKELVRLGARVHKMTKSYGNTPLHWAAAFGKIDMIAQLLDAGADANALSNKGETPAHSAAGAGQGEALAALIQAGADVNMKSKTGAMPLHQACAQGSLEAVKVLLNAEADSNHPDGEGYTPIQVANDRRKCRPAEACKVVAELLMQKGEKGEVVNEEGVRESVVMGEL
mmetsp:Transcript_22387/g.53644  ORF Transcript_22387/g.53644 Transcript_22387/m.53644 type:complete len:205 (+) Transcript_22387:189-803(+)